MHGRTDAAAAQLHSIADTKKGRAFALLPGRIANSQVASGTISGEVRDASGSIVPDVQIKLTEMF